MSRFAGGLITGLLLAVPLGIGIGKAYARAMRAYRDLMAMKKAIKGLFQRTVSEWWTVIRVTAGATLGLVLVLAAGVWAAIR